MKPRPIVYINQTLGMGGAENFISQLLFWFGKNGVPVKAWVTHDPFGKVLKAGGIKAQKIPFIVDLIGNWKGLIKGILLMPLAGIFYAGIILALDGSEVIILSGFIEKILVTPWAKLLNFPVVWIEFGPLGSVFKKFFGFPGFLYRLVSKLPDYVIESSLNTQRKNKKIAGFPINKSVVIPCGIAPLKLKPAKTKKLTAYCVSRLEAGKGQDILIKAWPKVLNIFPKARLYLIGKGDFGKELAKLVGKMGLKKSVVFLGEVKDLARTVSPLSLGVFPSIWPLEGFGLVLLEAMSLGKPIVCFKVGPYPEIINSRCAVMVEKGNVDGLSDAIVRVFSNPKFAGNLGKNGRERFNKLFTIDKVAPQFRNILDAAHVGRQVRQSKVATYLYDLKYKGIRNFVLDRIKKRRITRKIYSFFRKSYVKVGPDKLYVDKMDTVVSDTLLVKGEWEPGVTKIFLKYAKGAKLVVDVGAHIGYFTLIASRALNKNGKVISFEPSLSNFKLISKNVEENGLTNVTAEKMAIDSRSRTKFIYLNSENYGDHRIYNPGGRHKKEIVKTTSFDDYFSKTIEPIDLLKIDIQGYELEAMGGALKLMKARKIKAVISEFWPGGIKEAGGNWKKYISTLGKNGFDLFEINDADGKLTPFSTRSLERSYGLNPTYTTNILAVLK